MTDQTPTENENRPRRRRAAQNAAEKERVFQYWYSIGQPGAQVLSRNYSQTPGGRLIPPGTLDTWLIDWRKRAKVMDEELRRELEAQLIQDRREFTRNSKALGRALQAKGAQFLQSHDIEQESTAIAAIRTGIELERGALLMPELYAMLARMDEKELRSLLAEQISALSPVDEELPELNKPPLIIENPPQAIQPTNGKAK